MHEAAQKPRSPPDWNHAGNSAKKALSCQPRSRAKESGLAAEPYTLREILEQPDSLRRLAESSSEIVELSRGMATRFKVVSFIGCGSSYYAGMVGEFFFNRFTGMTARALPASEFIAYQRPAAREHLAIALSRSGETTETVEAARLARRMGFEVLALTNNEKSALAQEAGNHLPIRAGPEKSVVMTKTFSSLVYGVQLLAAEVGVAQGTEGADVFLRGLENVPDLSRETIAGKTEQVERLVKRHLNRRTVFLGSGANFPVALEGALKLRETSCLSAETFHFLEFRHGPMAEVGEDVVVVALEPRGESSLKHLELLREIAEKRGRVIAVTNISEAVGQFDDVIELPWSLDEWITPPVAIAPLQLFACFYSMALGFNPDRPRHLTKVVRLGEPRKS